MKLNKCYEFNDSDQIKESYKVNGNNIIINADSDKYFDVMSSLVDILPSPLVMIIEVPFTKQQEEKFKDGSLHKDVYYMTGLNNDTAKFFMKSFKDILVEDGISNFGFASVKERMEVMKHKYNTLVVIADERNKFKKVLEDVYHIPYDEKMKTVHNLIDKDHPAKSKMAVDPQGKGIYDLVNFLKDHGLYLDHYDKTGIN